MRSLGTACHVAMWNFQGAILQDSLVLVFASVDLYREHWTEGSMVALCVSQRWLQGFKFLPNRGPRAVRNSLAKVQRKFLCQADSSSIRMTFVSGVFSGSILTESTAKVAEQTSSNFRSTECRSQGRSEFKFQLISCKACPDANFTAHHWTRIHVTRFRLKIIQLPFGSQYFTKEQEVPQDSLRYGFTCSRFPLPT